MLHRETPYRSSTMHHETSGMIHSAKDDTNIGNASITTAVISALESRENVHIEVGMYTKKYDVLYDAVAKYADRNSTARIVIAIPSTDDVLWVLSQISRDSKNNTALKIGIDTGLETTGISSGGIPQRDCILNKNNVYKLTDFVGGCNGLKKEDIPYALANFNVLVASYSNINYLIDYWGAPEINTRDISFVMVDTGHLEMTFTDILSISINRTALIAAGNALDSVNLNEEISDEIKAEYPGNLWNTKHVVSAIRRLIEFLKTKLKAGITSKIESETILQDMHDVVCLNEQTLMFLQGRFSKVAMVSEERVCIENILKWAKEICINRDGYRIIHEIERMSEPSITACCVDSKRYVSQILGKNYQIILFSGAIAERDTYLCRLGLSGMSRCRLVDEMRSECLGTLVVGRGNDQMPLSIVSGSQEDDSFMIRNYGSLLTVLSTNVPDNILCVFPNKKLMEKLICGWIGSGIFEKIQENKIVLVEHSDEKECEEIRRAYYKAFLVGKGAILCVTARGMMYDSVSVSECSERALVFIGVPEMIAEDECTRERIRMFDLDEPDNYLMSDISRLVTKYLDHSMESGAGSTLLVLADSCFENAKSVSFLAEWIQEALIVRDKGKSIDSALAMARECLLKTATND